MLYRLPVRINPTLDDVTAGSSAWIASRIRPGRGVLGVSLSHHRIVGNAAARIATTGPATAGLMCVTVANNTFRNATLAEIQRLEWNGIWTIASQTQAAVGHNMPALGLVAPLNTFNMGYRYRRGWRPQRVS